MDAIALSLSQATLPFYTKETSISQAHMAYASKSDCAGGSQTQMYSNRLAWDVIVRLKLKLGRDDGQGGEKSVFSMFNRWRIVIILNSHWNEVGGEIEKRKPVVECVAILPHGQPNEDVEKITISRAIGPAK